MALGYSAYKNSNDPLSMDFLSSILQPNLTGGALGVMPGDQPMLDYDPSAFEFGGVTSGFGKPGGLGGLLKDGGFGLNVDTAKLALSGIGTLASAWNAFSQNKLAKKQFQFSKDFATKNLNNQTQAYNTTLDGIARSRAVVEDQTPEQQQAFIDKNKLAGF